MLNLTTRAYLLSRQTKVEPQIILEIDGISLLFGAVDVTTTISYDTSEINYDAPEGYIYDGVAIDPKSRPYISIQGKTTKQIQQQIKIDGGTSSISNFTVELLNKNGELSDTFIPGLLIPDLLGRGANIYLALQGGAHPIDSIKIFDGVIGDFNYGPGRIVITVTHPEDLKRQECFTLIQTELTSAINSSQTNIPVISTNGVFGSQDSVVSFIRIDDEIMEISSFTSNSFTVLRGSLGTTAVSHDDEAEVSTFYRFSDGAMNCALKLMLSGGDEFYSTLSVKNINSVNGIFTQNAIEFSDFDLNASIGATAGDSISISGATDPANNVVRQIISVNTSSSGSFIIVDGANLVTESDGASCSFKSKYNVLADGAALLPRHVDILQHESLQEIYSSSFPDYVFYLKESLELKDFIDTEIYFPAGLYSLPRKGRISVGYSTPPLSVASAPVIDASNITNIKDVGISRSIKSSFYNAIVHKYNEQLLGDKLIASNITISADSQNRIPSIKNRPLNIESKGLRRDASTITILDRIQSRLIERYKFGAKTISNVNVHYKDGFTIEAGDIVSFGSQDTKIIDPDTGDYLENKLFEVVNRSLDIIGGSCSLTLLDTNYSIDAKFGVVSPSSEIGTGSTSSLIKIEKSFNTKDTQLETDKWVQYVGEMINVHNEDYSIDENVRLLGISPTLPSTLEVETLPFSPAAGLYIDLADYDESSLDANSFSKNSHAYLNYTTTTTTASSQTVFTVSDASKLRVGQTIMVHSINFVFSSQDVKITDITGLVITVDEPLGFTPSIGTYYVELIGFQDGGKPYRII